MCKQKIKANNFIVYRFVIVENRKFSKEQQVVTFCIRQKISMCWMHSQILTIFLNQNCVKALESIYQEQLLTYKNETGTNMHAHHTYRALLFNLMGSILHTFEKFVALVMGILRLCVERPFTLYATDLWHSVVAYVSMKSAMKFFICDCNQTNRWDIFSIVYKQTSKKMQFDILSIIFLSECIWKSNFYICVWF